MNIILCLGSAFIGYCIATVVRLRETKELEERNQQLELQNQLLLESSPPLDQELLKQAEEELAEVGIDR